MMRRAMAALGMVVAALAGSAPASAQPGPDLLLDTVAGPSLGSIGVDPIFAPQIGQSFVVADPLSLSRVVLRAEGLARAREVQSLGGRYQFSDLAYLHSGEEVDATTTFRLWRAEDGRGFPDTFGPPGFTSFDTATSGYTLVHQSVSTTPIAIGGDFALSLQPPVRLVPGAYLAAWHFSFPDKRIFSLTFWSASNGTSDYFQDGRTWIESVCSLPRLPDTSPSGTSAFTADQWAAPGGVAPSGPFPGTIGMTTWFRPTGGKSVMAGCPAYCWADRTHCDHRKAPGTVPADLDLRLYGTRS